MRATSAYGHRMPPAETSQVHTGATIRAMREEVGMSGRQLAKAIGVNHAHLARVEAGERPLSRKVQERISRAIADRLAS